jgi:hypothetical protein
MSFMIRIMLDWEMQQENIAIDPIFVRPTLNFEDESTHHSFNLGIIIRPITE